MRCGVGCLTPQQLTSHAAALCRLLSSGDLVVILARLVPVLDKPLEDFVTEEFELAGARSPVRGDHSLPSPGPDHLVRRREQLGEFLAVHDWWNVGVPLLVSDLGILLGHVTQPRGAQLAG